MFTSIRKSIAAFIAPKATATTTQQNMTMNQYSQPITAGEALKKPDPVSRNAIAAQRIAERTKELNGEIRAKGFITSNEVAQLHSERLKTAIAGLGAWSAMAQAFSLYQQHVRRNDTTTATKLEAVMLHFHEWNQSAGLSPEDVQQAVERMAIVKVTQNEQTDAILARVTGKSIEEVQRTRQEKADQQSRARLELIEAFCGELWGCSNVGGMVEASLPATKAYSKAMETLAWLGSWSNPDLGEIMIAEKDIEILERLAIKAGRIEDAAPSFNEWADRNAA